jgi:hypothetical protein
MRFSKVRIEALAVALPEERAACPGVQISRGVDATPWRGDAPSCGHLSESACLVRASVQVPPGRSVYSGAWGTHHMILTDRRSLEHPVIAPDHHDQPGQVAWPIEEFFDA